MTQTPPISAEQVEALKAGLLRLTAKGDALIAWIEKRTFGEAPRDIAAWQKEKDAVFRLALTAAASIPASRGVETLTLDGFGQALVIAMAARGATVRGLADQLGIDKSAISRARTGKGIEARHFIEMWNWVHDASPAPQSVQEQEPVEWRTFDHDDGKWFLFETEEEAKEVWPDRNVREPLYASPPEQELRAKVEALEAEVEHWRANHAEMVQRNAVLRERPDLPADRLPSIARYEAKVERLTEALKPFADVAWKWDVFEGDEEISIDLTADHLRAARAALEPKP